MAYKNVIPEHKVRAVVELSIIRAASSLQAAQALGSELQTLQQRLSKVSSWDANIRLNNMSAVQQRMEGINEQVFLSAQTMKALNGETSAAVNAADDLYESFVRIEDPTNKGEVIAHLTKTREIVGVLRDELERTISTNEGVAQSFDKVAAAAKAAADAAAVDTKLDLFKSDKGLQKTAQPPTAGLSGMYPGRMDMPISAPQYKPTMQLDLVAAEKAGLITAKQALQAKQAMVAMSKVEATASLEAAAAIRKVNEAYIVQKLILDALEPTVVKTADNAAKTTGAMADQMAKQTGFQKAGQGMILSMSLMQASAGNFQNALFGLGFSFLFVGEALKGATGAWALFFAALQVIGPMIATVIKGHDDLKDSMKEQTDRLAEWDKQLERVIFTHRGAGEAVVDFAKKLAEENIAVEEWLAEMHTSDKEVSIWADTVNMASDVVSSFFDALTPDTRLQSLGKWLKDSAKDLTALAAGLKQVNADIGKAKNDHRDDLISAEAARQRRLAFEDEQEGPKEAVKALENSLEEQANHDLGVQKAAINKASDLREKAIRKRFQFEEDTLDKSLNAQVDARQDALDKELASSKKRVDALVAAEKRLVEELNVISARRKEIFGELNTLTDEIAAINRLTQQYGAGEELVSELAIRQAREAALRNEDSQITERAGEIGGELAINGTQQEDEAAIQAAAKERYDIDVEAYKAAAEAKKELLKERLDDALEREQGYTAHLLTLADDERDAAQKTIDTRIQGEKDIITERERLFELAEDEIRFQDNLKTLLDSRLLIEQAITLELERQRDLQKEREESLKRMETYKAPVTGGSIGGPAPSRDVIAWLEDQIPSLPSLPRQHSGGTVAGLPGTSVPIMAMAGEEVVPLWDVGKSQASPQGGNTAPQQEPVINITITVAKMNANDPADLDKLATAISRKLGQRGKIGTRSGMYY